MVLSNEEIKKLNPEIVRWVNGVARLTKPSRIVWCDGSRTDSAEITSRMLDSKELIGLDQKEYENCYLFRNMVNDVSRYEERTFICTTDKNDAGPTNNWMAISDAKVLLNKLFDGVMEGRTMYVVPYLMGPKNSRFSQVGVELTDSPLVVLTMMILARVGKIALEHLGNAPTFIRGIHSTGTLKRDERYLCHFPEEDLIMSINTNYCGDAALNKKPHALRLASVNARKEGWLAEHMFITEVESPKGELSYISGALPSGSGKTNLAMIRPPALFSGWKVKTVGDDLAWLRSNTGEIMAVNPENGFFGVAYATGPGSNPNILDAIKKNTIFTNVGLTQSDTPWWEGLTPNPPDGVVDWTGNKWVPGSGKLIANKNSRFSVPFRQYSMKSDKHDDPEGVPISIIIFGGRRASLVPLVYEAYSWEHGLLLGTMMRVETTAARAGKEGEVRHDPMAMLAFCGYNMGDYFRHWIDFGKKISKKPRIFFVNWFRKDANGNYIWPGFSDNFRVLKWMIDRKNGEAEAVETPIGYMPKPGSIDTSGLKIKKEDFEGLFNVDKAGWLDELKNTKTFFEKFGDRMPKELWDEYYKLESRLKN